MLQVKRSTILAFLFPTFLIIALINIYPIIYVLNLSFTNKTTFSLDNYSYVGLKNYQAIFTKTASDFGRVLLNTTLYVIICVSLFLIVGMITALVLNNQRIKGLSIWRTLLILPWAVPTFVTALIWKFLYNYDFGPINQIIRIVTHNPHAGIAWLDEQLPAFIAVVLVNVWMSYPFFTIVILGALQSIPHELIEAASVDGATAWQRFTSVILPLLRPAIAPATILSAMTTFQMFNTVYLITSGGPFTVDINKPGATEYLIVWMYNLFQNHGSIFINYGKTSGIAVIVFFILFTITVLGLRATNFMKEEDR